MDGVAGADAGGGHQQILRAIRVRQRDRQDDGADLYEERLE